VSAQAHTEYIEQQVKETYYRSKRDLLQGTYRIHRTTALHIRARATSICVLIYVSLYMCPYVCPYLTLHIK